MITSRRLHFIFILAVISTISDEIALTGLLFKLSELTNSRSIIAIALLVMLIPYLALMRVAAWMVERRSPIEVILVCSACQVITMFAMIAATTVGTLLIHGIILSIFFTVSGPATFSLLPELGKRLNIGSGKLSGWIEVTRGVGMLAGPAFGGLVVATSGCNASFCVSIVILILFSLSIFQYRAHLPRRHVRVQLQSISPAALKPSRFFRSVSNRRLNILFLICGAIVICTAPAEVVYLFFITDILKGSAITFGLLSAVWAAGSILGAVYAGSRVEQWHLMFATSVSCVVFGASLMTCGVTRSMPSSLWISCAALSFFISGMASGVYEVCVRTALYTWVDETAHGRVFATYNALTSCATGIGFIVGGLFAAMPADRIYLYSGGATMATAFVGMLFCAKVTQTPKVVIPQE